MSSPFTNYDSWLTTDRLADAAEARAVHIFDAWEEYAESAGLPYEMADIAHPEHATIYKLWEALFFAVEAYGERLMAEQEAAYAEAEAQQEEHLAQIRDEEQMVLDSQRMVTREEAADFAATFLPGDKVIPCVVCGVLVEVPPSAERAWCERCR